MLNLPFLLKFFLVRSQLLCGTLGGFSSSMFAAFVLYMELILYKKQDASSFQFPQLEIQLE